MSTTNELTLERFEKLTLERFEKLELIVKKHSKLNIQLAESNRILIEANNNQNTIISKQNVILDNFLAKMEPQIELIEKNQIMIHENKKKLIIETIANTKISTNVMDNFNLIDRLSNNMDKFILNWNENLNNKLEEAKKNFI